MFYQMKRIVLTICMFLAVCQMVSAQKHFDKVKISNSNDSLSYALGYILANSIIKEGISDYDPTIIGRAFLDAKQNKSPLLNKEEAQNFLQDYFSAQEEEVKNKQLAKEKEFMDKNAKEPGVVTLESGLQYKIIKQGEGKMPTDTDEVKIHYEGKLIDGSVFDSSYDNEEPTAIAMSYLIPGMVEGLKLMKEGSEYVFYIPAELGYGSYDGGETLPPYSTLIFDVELVSVDPMPAEDENSDNLFDLEYK